MGSTSAAHKILQSAHVAPEIYKLRPDYRALLMVVEGIPPGPSDDSSEALLLEAEASAKHLLAEHAVTEVPHIAAWRETGREEFRSLAGGEVEVECAAPGEPVWCDDAGVTCRRWNWRQGPRTALTDDTTRVLFILDALGPLSDEALGRAAEELALVLGRLSPEVRVAQRMLSALDAAEGGS
ncbi:hypothetical protein H633G_10755 [Metarhizium anisopliae BRIP 53284]|nr:hypothetical protein H633G_10755 [Metarhizium anisopliae BRIP 53284]